MAMLITSHEMKPEMANVTVKQDADGFWVGGVFCGKQIATNLYAEEVASRRYVIRETEMQSFGRRLGEVMGGDGRFQACRMNGEHVGVKRALLEAACLLV